MSLKMLTSCFHGGKCCNLNLEFMIKIRRTQKKRDSGGAGEAKNELRQGRRLISLVKGKCVGVQRETCKCIPIFGNLNLQVSNKFGARVEELDLVKIKSFFN